MKASLAFIKIHIPRCGRNDEDVPRGKEIIRPKGIFSSASWWEPIYIPAHYILQIEDWKGRAEITIAVPGESKSTIHHAKESPAQILELIDAL